MLHLWMPEGDAAWRWRVSAGDNWQMAANWEALLQATANDVQKEAIVFFPTNKAQMMRQMMTRQQLRQIGASGVRYLLEEFALVSVDQLAVFYQLDVSEHLNIMALPASLIEQYQHVMALGKWRIQAYLPDFLLVPTPADLLEAQLIINQQQRTLRTSDYMAYCADDLAILLDYMPELTHLNVWGDIEPKDQQAIDALIDLKTTTHQWTDTLFPLSDAQLIRHPYNVLPKTRTVVSGYWRAAAAVLVVGLLVQMTYDSVRIWRYNKVADQVNAMAVHQYQSWFPEERRIVNLRQQFEGHLQDDSSTDLSALTLISRVGPLLQQANMPASQVQYRDNTLELTVLASNLPALEALRSQFSEQGLKAELGSVNPASGQVSGLIRVQL